MEFEWDPEKAIRNERKHGISFYEAITVFNDPNAYTFADPDHSFHEDRYLAFAYSDRNRLLTVSYTYQGKKTRLISAREATRTEREIYAE